MTGSWLIIESSRFNLKKQRIRFTAADRQKKVEMTIFRHEKGLPAVHVQCRTKKVGQRQN